MPPKTQPSRTSSTASTSSIKTQYLTVYNTLSALLWVSLLFRVITALSTTGLSGVYPSTGTFARNIQTLALAEIFHSLFGIVRAPLFTTATQVASRVIVIWGVVDRFADALGLGASASGSNQIAYTGLMVAWGVTEVVRYSYFMAFLGRGNVPSGLTWARYNLFFALYPLGISCEVWLMWHALPAAETVSAYYTWFFRGALVAYVPGSWVMFTHMMGQRRRVARGKGRVKG